MTVMPISPAPVDAAAPGTAGAPGPAGDFLAAILQALSPGADPTDGATAVAVPVPATPDTDPAALGLVVPPGLAAQLVAPVVALDGDPAPGHANVAPEAAGGPTDPTGDIRMSGNEVPTTVPGAPPATAGADGVAQISPGRHGTDPAQPGAATAEPHDPGTPGAVAGTTPRAHDAGRSESVAPATPQPTPTTSAAPLLPAATSTSPPSTTAPQHVTGQVFPEVSRLVSRGDGTHRITLDLNPESLGEVRVVMTVRDGTVHVRFAAGHEAGRALLDGSAELNRLLGAAGASETRIVVRELSAAVQPTADGATPGPDLGPGPGGDRSQDQHAGTRAEHHATDGSDTTTPGSRGTGASQPRSTQPVTRARLAGVDVTM